MSESQIVDMLLFNGWVFEIAAGEEASARCSVQNALEDWIKLGLKVREVAGRRYFDAVEVSNFVRWVGVNGQHAFWKDRCVATGRRLVRDLAARAESQSYNGHRFTLRRKFNLEDVALGAPVRLRLPLPAPDQGKFSIAVSTLTPNGLEGSATCKDARLEVRFQMPKHRQLTFGVDVSLEQAEQGSPSSTDSGLSAEDRELYLRLNEGVIRTSPKVVEFAKRVAGDHPADKAASHLFHALVDYVICGTVSYEQVSPDAPLDWVIDSGWCDCRLGSALLIALCRSLGIPARMVGGYLLYTVAPTNHFWVEVYQEGQGWLSFDFLNWELSEGGLNPDWRNCFDGWVDQRLITERLPLVFTGSMSVRLPEAWRMLQSVSGNGVAIRFVDAVTATLIYEDIVSLEQATPVMWAISNEFCDFPSARFLPYGDAADACAP